MQMVTNAIQNNVERMIRSAGVGTKQCFTEIITFE